MKLSFEKIFISCLLIMYVTITVLFIFTPKEIMENVIHNINNDKVKYKTNKRPIVYKENREEKDDAFEKFLRDRILNDRAIGFP